MISANTAEIRDRLVEILRDDMFVVKDVIEDDDELITDLGLDSANVAIGLVAIEQRLRVVLTHQDVVECPTFGALVEITATKSKAARMA